MNLIIFLFAAPEDERFEVKRDIFHIMVERLKNNDSLIEHEKSTN